MNSWHDHRTKNARERKKNNEVMSVIAWGDWRVPTVEPYAIGMRVTAPDGGTGRISHHQPSMYDLDIHYYVVNGITYEHKELEAIVMMEKPQSKRKEKRSRKASRKQYGRYSRQQFAAQAIAWFTSDWRLQLDNMVAIRPGYVLWRLLDESKAVTVIPMDASALAVAA